MARVRSWLRAFSLSSCPLSRSSSFTRLRRGTKNQESFPRHRIRPDRVSSRRTSKGKGKAKEKKLRERKKKRKEMHGVTMKHVDDPVGVDRSHVSMFGTKRVLS